MIDSKDLRLFISWSGSLSKDVAQALRDWIPLLFDTVTPFMSDHDIAAGQRGLNLIETELVGTQFGIIVVTQENQHAPWLNFEAGAMSKQITVDREQRVVPLLVDLDAPSQVTGPLVQFQIKRLDQDGIRRTMRSVGELAGIRPEVVDARVQSYWSQLEEKVAAAKDSKPAGEVEPPRRVEDMLDEILTHLRDMRRVVIPPAYGWAGVNAPDDATISNIMQRELHKVGLPGLQYTLGGVGPGKRVFLSFPKGTSTKLIRTLSADIAAVLPNVTVEVGLDETDTDII